MNWLNRNEEIIGIITGAIIIIIIGTILVGYYEEHSEDEFLTDEKDRSVQEFEAMAKKHGCELGVREIEYHTDGSVKKVICTVRGE